MSFKYEIRRGKYGLYFFDIENSHDVTLQEALNKMNAYENLKKYTKKELDNLFGIKNDGYPKTIMLSGTKIMELYKKLILE